jgi:hypothetical protein
VAVVGALCAIAAGGAGMASAAEWSGTTHGKIVRENRLVAGGTNWRGSFWFDVNRRGSVRGYAVVAYEPVVDTGGITNAIGYVRDIGQTALGILGPFGDAAGGAVLGQIVGAGVSFKKAVAIRRGPLRGELKGRRLDLQWDANLSGIGYDIEFVMASGKKRIGGGRAALRSPFQGAGSLVGRGAAVRSFERESTADGTDEKVGSYWEAHRVG